MLETRESSSALFSSHALVSPSPSPVDFNFFLFFKFYFIFKLYIIVLVLPNIKMNPPQVYMCSPSWTLLPPPSPYHPSGSSQCTSPKHPVSCIECWFQFLSFLKTVCFYLLSTNAHVPLTMICCLNWGRCVDLLQPLLLPSSGSSFMIRVIA